MMCSKRKNHENHSGIIEIKFHRALHLEPLNQHIDLAKLVHKKHLKPPSPSLLTTNFIM